jgi:hypothetical protein
MFRSPSSKHGKMALLAFEKPPFSAIFWEERRRKLIFGLVPEDLRPAYPIPETTGL